MYFCLGLFVLNACTLEEDAIHQHKRDEKIKIERQSFNELMKTNQFSKAMSKVPKKKVQVTNSLGRTQMEEQYGFTIVDTPVKIIEFEGKTTYTIQIIKDENTDNKIENLVLYQTPIDDKIGYIVKYNSEIGTPKTEEEISEDGISELETLTSTGTLSQKTTIYVVYLVASCVLKPGDPAYCGGDPSNPNFTSACQSYHYDVITFGGGGDISGNGGGDDTSGPGTGSGPGEGGGGSGNGDNPEPVDPTVIPNHGATSPLNCGTCPILDESDPPIDHIQQLNTMTNRTEVKERILELKSQVTTVAMEQGTEFFVNEEDPSFEYDGEDPPTGITGVRFGPIDYYSIIRMHSHNYPGIEPVFSGEDVKNTGFFFKKKVDFGAEDANNITSILLSTGIYALRVTDEEKAYQFGVKATNDTFVTLFLDRYEKNVRDKSKIDCGCLSGVAYEQALFDNLILFLAEESTGLSLYSASVDTSGNLSWSILP